MSITTKLGDSGSTRLIFGRSVGKDHPAIAAVGDADELDAVLGLARLHVQRQDIVRIIARAQEDIVAVMGQLSAGSEDAARYHEKGFRGMDQTAVDRLTAEGAALEAEFPNGFHTWSVPGATGVAGSAWLELARCVCRRAERSVVVLMTVDPALDPVIPAWLNRLSDVLWLCARCEEQQHHTAP
ncbi:MAG TPA: cob(I)yrinic acid a,c-diamide adenosyltransferase [Verrucomicrobiales bacterium]|nr:cob(I)yrinic acid a,c-diamide adenosyltransferase [Verrucomicrobiales bacterium]